MFACARSLLTCHALCKVLKAAPTSEQLALDALVAELSKHNSVHEALSKMDKDHDGVINTGELGVWLTGLGIGLDEEQLASVMRAFGPDHPGTINYRDFYKLLKRGVKKSGRHHHHHHHQHHANGSQTARESRVTDALSALSDGSQTARELTSSSPTVLTSATAAAADGVGARAAKPIGVGSAVSLDWNGADEDESDWEGELGEMITTGAPVSRRTPIKSPADSVRPWHWAALEWHCTGLHWHGTGPYWHGTGPHWHDEKPGRLGTTESQPTEPSLTSTAIRRRGQCRAPETAHGLPSSGWPIRLFRGTALKNATSAPGLGSLLSQPGLGADAHLACAVRAAEPVLPHVPAPGDRVRQHWPHRKRTHSAARVTFRPAALPGPCVALRCGPIGEPTSRRPSPGADVGKGEPSPGTDVARVMAAVGAFKLLQSRAH